jgi:catechol 2,3-dioxygenase-like lactoylglutathione lyase family enzyme
MLWRMLRPPLSVLGCVVASAAHGQEAKRPPITGIAYVRIYAKDRAATRRFYTQELRLPETKCPVKACARYQVGKDQYVEVVNAIEPQPDGIQVIAFRTTDAEALRRYLAARRVTVPPAVTHEPDGSAAFAVTDAEAHRIAFIEPKRHAKRQGAISHRLIHVGFVVKDRAAMDSLYQDILGFRPYWHGGMQPDRTDWVSLQVPDGSDWLEYMLNVPPAPSHHLIGVLNHFALGVANMDTTEAALERTGWKPHGEEHKQMGLDGKYQLNVFDPDEVRVEFMDFSPSQQPCCSVFTAPHPQPH